MRNPAAGMALVAGLVTGLVTAAVPHAAVAQSPTDRQREIEGEINSLRARVGEASAEESKLLGALDVSAAAKRALDAKVASLDAQIGTVQRKLSATRARLAEVEAEKHGAESKLATAQRELEEARIRLANYAVAAYTGRSDAVEFLTATLRSNNMDEMVAKRSYLRAVGTTQAEVIALDERLRNEVKDLTGQLAKVVREAQAQAAEVESQKSELQAARDSQEAVRSEVSVEIAKTEAVKAEVVSRKEEFLAHEQTLQAESGAIAAQLRALAAAQRAAAAAPPSTTATGDPAPAPAGGSSTATPTSRGMVPPLDGISVTSPFGYRIHPIYGTSTMHTGVDLAASTGQSIYATAAGKVVTSGWMNGYGNTIVIDHGGGLATLYAHQSALIAGVGQSVSQGQTVGRVGCTGSCTGPHLHFEVRVDGSPVNPMNYI